jgi:hypothetical protein
MQFLEIAYGTDDFVMPHYRCHIEDQFRVFTQHLVSEDRMARAHTLVKGTAREGQNFKNLFADMLAGIDVQHHLRRFVDMGNKTSPVGDDHTVAGGLKNVSEIDFCLHRSWSTIR